MRAPARTVGTRSWGCCGTADREPACPRRIYKPDSVSTEFQSCQSRVAGAVSAAIEAVIWRMSVQGARAHNGRHPGIGWNGAVCGRGHPNILDQDQNCRAFGSPVGRLHGS
jgi:hypothetical protein